jgi:hypothetical protein
MDEHAVQFLEPLAIHQGRGYSPLRQLAVVSMPARRIRLEAPCAWGSFEVSLTRGPASRGIVIGNQRNLVPATEASVVASDRYVSACGLDRMPWAAAALAKMDQCASSTTSDRPETAVASTPGMSTG